MAVKFQDYYETLGGVFLLGGSFSGQRDTGNEEEQGQSGKTITIHVCLLRM